MKTWLDVECAFTFELPLDSSQLFQNGGDFLQHETGEKVAVALTSDPQLLIIVSEFTEEPCWRFSGWGLRSQR